MPCLPVIMSMEGLFVPSSGFTCPSQGIQNLKKRPTSPPHPQHCSSRQKLHRRGTWSPSFPLTVFEATQSGGNIFNCKSPCEDVTEVGHLWPNLCQVWCVFWPLLKPQIGNITMNPQGSVSCILSSASRIWSFPHSGPFLSHFCARQDCPDKTLLPKYKGRGSFSSFPLLTSSLWPVQSFIHAGPVFQKWCIEGWKETSGGGMNVGKFHTPSTGAL